ncbi:hypothetical protein GCM10007036_37540 [Alsobacter metallidurans]|uniref:DUF1499 domain-containing protein n=1 Tax=Alsobacter metallidurans TaxID=340221 RepID=A0A917MJR3_9HYPH|nr:DUF1499 domain-containing protein [Alsobacter metallidurans]GGH28377.1 hypothetical protein GCM10007036_37540 [Alsobacter metallidurans]
MRGFVIAIGVAALAAGVVVLRKDAPGGIGRVWELVGPADQGRVDFAHLARRPGRNDALVCPAAFCAAPVDLIPPRYAATADELLATLRSLILANPDARLAASSADELRDRYVVRTPLMRFPDTVEAVALPAGEGGATLAIYSRSLVGSSDFGVNLKRVKGWLADPRLVKLQAAD